MPNPKETLDLVVGHNEAFKALINLVKGDAAPKALRPLRLAGEMKRRLKKRLLLWRGKFCHWCDCPVTERQHAPDEATMDHVIPRYFGGPNHCDNLVISCRRCNEERDNTPDILEVLEYFGVNLNTVRKYTDDSNSESNPT